MPDDTHAPALVLLPGLDGTGILFRPLLASLPADLRVQVITYPRDRLLDLSALADHVAAQLPPGEVVLLAESFSGLVALHLLARGDARIRKVLFVAAFGEPPRPLLLRAMPKFSSLFAAMRFAPAVLLRRFCLGSDAGEPSLALLRSALAAVSPTVLAHRMRIVAQGSGLHAQRWSIPCHYLQAKHDRLVPSLAARWFETHFASCEITSIPGPHFVLQTEPQRCAAWIAERVLEKEKNQHEQ